MGVDPSLPAGVIVSTKDGGRRGSTSLFPSTTPTSPRFPSSGLTARKSTQEETR